MFMTVRLRLICNARNLFFLRSLSSFNMCTRVLQMFNQAAAIAHAAILAVLYWMFRQNQFPLQECFSWHTDELNSPAGHSERLNPSQHLQPMCTIILTFPSWETETYWGEQTLYYYSLSFYLFWFCLSLSVFFVAALILEFPPTD